MAKWHFDPDTEEFKCDALYFIREGKDGPIKIGRGKPESRVKTLQIGNARRLRIIGTIEDAGYTEAFWHEAFADLRMIGEWFRPNTHLLAAIDWALKGQDWADEVEAPPGTDPERFRDEMLDCYEWYREQIWMGNSERASAVRAVAVAFNQALYDETEIERLNAQVPA